MTLGNSQPPLTRRQAREAASALQRQSDAEQPDADTTPSESVESAPVEPAQSDAAPAADSPTGRKPRAGQKRRGPSSKAAPAADASGPSDATSGDAAESGQARPAAIEPDAAPPMTSFAPRASGSGAASAAPKPSQDVTGRTLTRRELRALNAAEAADAREFESEAAEDKIVPAAPARQPDSAVSKPAVSKPAAGKSAAGKLAAGKSAATDSASSGAVDESPDAEQADDESARQVPAGHWSVDTGDDERPEAPSTQSLDDLMSLGMGAGGSPTTSNALILPLIPNQGTTSGPLSNTGEILITGSFDLPRSLGETGQHPNHFDSADVDQMIDQLDDGSQTDNAPVSASRAVSTHASTRNVMTPPKKSGVTLPVVLVVSTAALAVSVSALLFVGHLLQIF